MMEPYEELNRELKRTAHCPTCRCDIERIRAARTQIDILARLVNTTYAALVGFYRAQPMVAKRQTVITAFRKLNPDLSFPATGRLFHRDHSTIIHSVHVARADVVNNLLRKYAETMERARLRESLTQEPAMLDLPGLE